MQEKEREEVLSSVSTSIAKLAYRWALSIPACNAGWIDEDDLYIMGMTKAYMCLSQYDPSSNTKVSTWVLGCVKNHYNDVIRGLRLPMRFADLQRLDQSLEEDDDDCFMQVAAPPVHVDGFYEQVEAKILAAISLLCSEPEALQLLSVLLSGKRLTSSAIDPTSPVVNTLREVFEECCLTLDEFLQFRSVAVIN